MSEHEAPILTTRLRLRRFNLADAPFILQLVNEPSFLQHIGDKGVRSLDDAEGYLREGPLASYAQFGFGLQCVEAQHDRMPMGMCGLLQRPYLPQPDLGFAFLPRFWGQGYAEEAARATLAQARVFGVSRVLAIVAGANDRSIRLLQRLGLRRDPDLESLPPDRNLQVFAVSIPVNTDAAATAGWSGH